MKSYAIFACWVSANLKSGYVTATNYSAVVGTYEEGGTPKFPELLK
jgi:hypothetical protein